MKQHFLSVPIKKLLGLVKRRRNLLLISVPIVCLCVLGWFIHTAWQRVRLRGPLVDAVKRNDALTVKALLARGADPNTRDAPQLPFSWEDVWQFFRHPQHKDPFGPPVLQYAILQGNGDIARMLIAQGAEVNAQSDYWPEVRASVRMTPAGSPTPTGGYTALMDAAFIQRADLVGLLLEHDADPNLAPSGERPPLMLALTENDMLNLGEVPHTQEDQTAIVRMLLEHGADARAVLPNGETAVRLAIDADWSAVRLLVEKGGDANTRTDDKWGRTLLIEAAVLGDAPMIRFLVEHGAEVNATDKEGRTALMQIGRVDNMTDRGVMEIGGRPEGESLSLEGCRFLLDHGANPNMQDKEGVTALMEAAGVGRKDEDAVAGNVEIVRLLLQRGADLSAKDKSGRTALQKLPPVYKEDTYGLQLAQLLRQGAANR